MLVNGVYRQTQFIVTWDQGGNLLSYQSARELGAAGEIKTVAKEIGYMLAQDIIEPVDDPTPLVSAIVPVPKTPGEFRICSDERAANKRSCAHDTCPTIDGLVVNLNNARVITKLDLKTGYNQLVIEPESRYITTFCTHFGLFRYKRLNLGINAASEIFQRVISQLICGVAGAINLSDEIIIHGADQAEHDARLDALLRRLSGLGLTLNPIKCEFAKSELDFYGLAYSCKNLTRSSAKSASEVKSLLGLANYCSRFINNLATIVASLRDLCKPKSTFEWTATLDALKEALITQAAAYFKDDWNSIITVDAQSQDNVRPKSRRQSSNLRSPSPS